MKARVALYGVLGGAPFLWGALGAGHWANWWLAGIVLAAAFVPVALFGPHTSSGQFAVIAPALVIISVVCTWSEAVIFLRTPGMQEHLVGSLVWPLMMYGIVAGVLSFLARWLRLVRPSRMEPLHYGVARAVPLVLLCGAAYVLYYALFGSLTYHFFTRIYYPEAARTVAKLGLWFWAIQFTRGVLMTVAVVPILYTLRMRRWEAMVGIGLVMWVAGGLAPLLIPNPFMGFAQRMVHVVEIFTQNFALGVTLALLLRRKDKPMPALELSAPEPNEGASG